MAVRGSLQDLDLLSLLQMTCEEGGDAQITLQRGLDTATLYIQAGQIVHAEGRERSGEEIVHEVLAWKNGTFALARTIPSPTVTIQRDWNSLLLEGLRRLDEQNGTDDEHEVEVRQKTILAVSDSAPLLATIATAIAPYASELALITAATHAEAIALLASPPDVLLLAWQGAPTLQGALFTHLVGQKVPIPTVLLMESQEARLPSVTPFNPAIFLAIPPNESELMAAVWGQVAREATGEPVGLPLYTLCEWVRLSKHTCLIRVSAPHDEGMLAFVDGVLLNAVSGQKLGEIAVKNIFGWEGISIEFATVGAKVKPLIQRSLKAILSGSEGQKDTDALRLPLPTTTPAAASSAETAPLFIKERADASLLEAPLTEEAQKEEKAAVLPVPDTDSVVGVPDADPPASPTTTDLSPPSSATEVAPAAVEVMPISVTVAPDTDTGASPTIHSDVESNVTPPSTGVDEMAGQTTESKIEKTLADIMTINGALGVALVDITSGMALGKTGNTGLDLDIAAAGNSEVVKAKLNVMKDLGIRGQIEDILITLQTQYHLIRPLGSDSTLFLYVVLNKDVANLALARRQLSKSEAGLVM